MLSQYLNILVFFFVISLIASVMIILAYLVAPKVLSLQKISSYECGFEPFQSARMKFNIHFYVIAMLFLLFDLEVAYIFPWLYVAGSLNSVGLSSMFIFIIILTVGFYYEWVKGALNW